MTIRLLGVLGVPVSLGVVALLAVQDPADGESTRALWNTKFAAARTQAGGAPQPASSSEAFIGVTVWRLRGARSSDPPGVRLLVHALEFTPERVDAHTPLAVGEQVRIGVECARAGYLYVIDRERYASGEVGPPYLIFPTRRIQGGKNRVRAGRLVEIPDAEDTPPYFTLSRSRPDQLGEQLTIILSPRPLPEAVSGSDLRLDPAKVRQWERNWGAGVKMLNTPAGAKTMTPAERDSASGGPLLRAGDPLPQRMYRVEAPPRQPVLVSLELNVRR
jgi:hypothetical protein